LLGIDRRLQDHRDYWIRVKRDGRKQLVKACRTQVDIRQLNRLLLTGRLLLADWLRL
jgi:hypothetical protein